MRADLSRRADGLRAGRTPYVLATVVRAQRPTSAKAGDRALVLADGTIEGFVGGACAESTVRLHGLRLLRTGESTLLRISPTAEDLDAGPEAVGSATEGLVIVGNPCLSGGTLDIFLEAVIPPPLVYVYGAAPVARAMSAVGAALGYSVTLTADPRAAIPPDAAAVVVASHGQDEEPVLLAALAAHIGYVGLVASRRRGVAVLAGLDVSDADRARVSTPAGLDIGARTASEVALSVFAEIILDRTRPGAGAGRTDRADHAPGDVPGEILDHTAPETAAGKPEARPAGGGRPGPVRAMPPAVSDQAGADPETSVMAAPGTDPASADLAGTEAIDPVCGMTVAVSPASLQAGHDGRTWYFCGSGCRQAFLDDPARYAR